MAVKTYRYRWPTGADIVAELAGGWISPAPVLLAANIFPSSVDLNYEEATKAQLDNAMASLGWIYDSEIPP